MDVRQFSVGKLPCSIQSQIYENRSAESGAKDGNGTNEVVVRSQKGARSPLLTSQLAEKCFVDGMVDAENNESEINARKPPSKQLPRSRSNHR